MRHILVAIILCVATPALGQDSPEPVAPEPSTPTVVEPPKPEPPKPDAISILFTSDIYGRYAWPGCDSRPIKGRAGLANLVSAVQEQKDARSALGEPEPVVVAGGSMIRPDIMGNLLFAKGAPQADKMVDLIRRVGFDAVAVGAFDFGSKPEALLRYMEGMSAAKIPLLAANVTCDDEKDFRCAHLGGKDKERFVMFQRGGLKVAVFSLSREDLPSRVIEKSRGSLKAAKPLDTARAMIKDLRGKHGADLVILLANLNVEGDSPGAVLRFLRRLGPDSPDLVVADTLYDRHNEDFIGQIRPNSLPPIVGTDRFAQHLGRATIRYKREGGKVVVQGVEVALDRAADSAPEPEAHARAETLMQELCAQVSAPIQGAVVKEPLTLDNFRVYLMELMRNKLNAEVALLNDSSIADTAFPFQGPLDRELLLRAIRSQTHLGFFKMDGATLIKKIALPYVVGGKSGLRVLGIVKKGKKYYINNRLVNEGHHYKVATTAFVASGGDGLVSLWTERFKDSGVALRDAVIQFFEERGHAAEDGDPDVDLSKDFPDPWQKWLLYSGLDMGLFFNTLTVDNGTAGDRYSKPSLTKDSVTNLKVDVGVELGASNRDHTVEADLALQYGHGWTLTAEDKAADKDSTSAEVLDQIRMDLIYRLTKLRNSESPGIWYMPVPYAEATLISEFTPSGCTPYATCQDSDLSNDDTYHYLNLTGTVGVGLLAHPMFFVKLGFAVDGELLTPDEARAPGEEDTAEIGIYFGYKLRRMRLNDSKHYPIQLESRLDFYMTDMADTIRREVSWESKLFFNLLPMFYITASHRMYVFDIRGKDLSVANDISLGLEFITDYRYQLF